MSTNMSTGQMAGVAVGLFLSAQLPGVSVLASANSPTQIGNLIEPAEEAKERKNDHP